jgi:hypothetical protein
MHCRNPACPGDLREQFGAAKIKYAQQRLRFVRGDRAVARRAQDRRRGSRNRLLRDAHADFAQPPMQ